MEIVTRFGNICIKFWKWIIVNKVIAVLIFVFVYLCIEFLPVFFKDVESLKHTNPKSTALMIQRIETAKDRGEKYIIRQKWIPLSRISPHLIHAVIVAEDGTFYEHEGVDWYEVKEAIKKDIKKGKFARGASTITQQLAKNLFFSTSKNPLRKLKELIMAKRLENALAKNRILELYLNLIEWGDGIFGAEAASNNYFYKSASELTRSEAVRLACVIPSPLKYRPNEDSRYIKWREKIITARLDMRGW